MTNINTVTITGNLTRDPELRQLASGTSVCGLRVAVNNRERIDGEWTDRPNYFEVAVFGGRGESAARYLAKGRAVAVHGQLRWREWEAEDGTKRQAVSITASQVQFLGSPKHSASEGEGVPAERAAPTSATAGPNIAADDDLPF
ncbi:MAG: single-stranded DNA-binding protein [Solirubrobacterales bacterium]|nr:single-stranded DNA-binding protein [Solirubrobacterales bacterium]